MYGFFVLLIASVWIGVLLFPGEAVFRDVSPVPFQVQGLYPAVSSNGVGEIGAVLLLWSTRLADQWPGAAVAGTRLSIALGAMTLIASQYRTGYLGRAVALTLLLVVRGRRVLALLAAVGVVAAAIWSGPALTKAVEPYVLRGHGPRTGDGALRTHRPLEEVAACLARVTAPRQRPSTETPLRYWLHWVLRRRRPSTALGSRLSSEQELSASPCSPSFSRSSGARRSPISSRATVAYPSLIVTFVAVRSITGPTFEVFGVTMLLLLLLLYRLGLAAREDDLYQSRRGA